MLIKRIQAESLQEALQRVRTECGEDALLIETRKTSRGYLIVATNAGSAMEQPRRGASELVKKTPDLLKQIPSAIEGYPVAVQETGESKALDPS